MAVDDSDILNPDTIPRSIFPVHSLPNDSTTVLQNTDRDARGSRIGEGGKVEICEGKMEVPLFGIEAKTIDEYSRKEMKWFIRLLEGTAEQTEQTEKLENFEDLQKHRSLDRSHFVMLLHPQEGIPWVIGDWGRIESGGREIYWSTRVPERTCYIFDQPGRCILPTPTKSISMPLEVELGMAIGDIRTFTRYRW